MEAKDRNTEAEPISAETLAAINASNDIRNADGTKHIITADELRLAYPTRRECEIIAEVAKNEAARDVPEFMRIFTKRHANAIKRAYKISPELAVDIFLYAFEYICNAAEMLKRYTDAKPQTKDEDAAQWAEVEEIVSLHNCIAAHGYEFVMAADGLRRMFIHYNQCLCREMGAERWEANFQRQYARLGDGDKIECAAMLDLGGRNLIFHIAELEELSKAFADAETQGDTLEPIPADAGIFSCLQWVANLPPDVKTAARCILFVMFAFRNSKTGDCFPTVATIAKCAGLSLPHTKRLLRDLRERGYFQVGKRKTRNGDGNTYKLCLPNAQKVSSTIPTDSAEGIIHDAEGIICDAQKVSSTIPEHRILEQRKNNGGGVASSDEEKIISEVAALLRDTAPNRTVWLEHLRRLGTPAFMYLAGKARKDATSNAGAFFSSMLPNADPEAIRLEANGERRKIYIFCNGKCANFFDDSSDGGWIGCKARLNANGNYNLTKCPNFTPTAESTQPQSTEEGRRAATSAREARDGDYPF